MATVAENALAVCTDDFVLDTVAFGIRGVGRDEVAAQLGLPLDAVAGELRAFRRAGVRAALRQPLDSSPQCGVARRVK